jgi:hypothetical protein
MMRLIALVAALLTVACATQRYTSSTSVEQVTPSKGWHKSGVTGKAAYLEWQQCIAEAKEQAGYLDAKRIAESVPDVQRISERTQEDMRRQIAPHRFIGKYSDGCMTKRGFSYGKTTDVYIPPRPPEKAWVNSKLPAAEASRLRRQCYDKADEQTPGYEEARRNRRLSDYRKRIIDDCMKANGFTYDVVESSQ